jgi:hypothetical protein
MADPQEPMEPVEPTEPTEPQEPMEPQEPAEPTDEPGFNKKQLAQISSIMGNIVKKQLSEMTPSQPQEPSMLPNPSGNEAIDRFNQEVMNKWLAGDALGAYNMLQDVSNKAKTNLTQKQKAETDRFVVGYSEKPYYKDIFKEMQTMAHDLADQGYPPQAAADAAYAKTSLAHLEKIKAGNSDTGDLGMLEGGKKPPKSKKLVLPPHFKDACERDIEAGLFKDEQEWIANLAPNVRKAYDLE